MQDDQLEQIRAEIEITTDKERLYKLYAYEHMRYVYLMLSAPTTGKRKPTFIERPPLYP